MWLRFPQPVTLGAEVVDLIENAVEQRLGRGARYADALKPHDLLALSQNLLRALDAADGLGRRLAGLGLRFARFPRIAVVARIPASLF